MGDNDVICLSSDDEVAQDELPQKKQITNTALLIAKIEPKEKENDTVVCSRKRRNSEDSDEPDSKLMKKTKIGNNDVEEIIIESPIKATNDENRPNTTIREHSSKVRVEVKKDVTENGTISITKVTIKKTSELSKPSIQPKSSHSTAPISPVQNDVQKLQSTTGSSKESNSKIADASKAHNSKSTSENSGSRVLNPVAKLKARENAKSPNSTMSKMVHKFFETKVDERAKSENTATPLMKPKIETPKAATSTITADKDANGTSPKLQDETPMSSAMSSKIVDLIENPKADSVEIADKSPPDRENTPPKKSDDSQTIREPSESPELLILPSIDTPKISNTASDKTGVKAHLLDSSDDASNSEGKRTQNIEDSTSGIPISTKKSELPAVTSCQILNDDSKKEVLNKTTDLINGIRETTASPSLTATEDSDTTKSSSKSEARGPKTKTKDDEGVIKRITPQQLPESQSKSNPSKSDVEKTSKYFKNSTSHNSKESDAKIANRSEKPMSNDAKNSRPKEKTKSKDFEPTPGCSKTPDEKFTKSPSVLSSLKRKSTSSEDLEKVKKRSEDASKSVDVEPQLGCSKSPKEINQKPRLVVVDKKPVSHEAEDTFSMFLSLCLQTDRCPDMEKVVAKLKHYYEQLNPAYAASQAFRDTLNEKRELIMKKGKKVVYHYVQLLKKDMKAKKKMEGRFAKAKDGESTADGADEEAHEDIEEEDTEEARRKRQKIKRIEKAMKECQKMIKKYEEAEIDFEDENNSHYIKLDRFKERMVELYTQMCKYTHEHPDAGRSYLRPKHLRVTQIPSIDQAINSFINSKLSFNKRKITKGKSFVDGLIFPDYVDILECVEKVNKEQELKLDKRARQRLAEKAFTQLGKHLQEARQNDYWDTFSLNLDNNVDPATSDTDLLEKLSRNKKVAEANEKKVFAEFVRKQEEGKGDDKDDSPSEGEDEDDEDEEEEEEDNDNDKRANHIDESDVEMSADEDSEQESEKGDKDDTLKALEVVSEAPQDEDEECTVEDDSKHISYKNDHKASKQTADNRVVSPASTPKKSAGEETKMLEVILDDVDTEDGKNEPIQEEKVLQPLRIRSFAKPPDSWKCSQEFKEETNEDNGSKPETLDSTEEEITVPTNQVQVLRLVNGKYVTATVASRLAIGTPPMQPRPSWTRIQPRPLNPTQLTRGGISATSTPAQPRPNIPQQNKALTPVTLSAAQCSQMQVLRLSNGKYVTRPISSSENSRIPREQQIDRNAAQQQQKVTNGVSTVVVPVKGANIVGQTTTPVLKPRMNDNVQTVQQQRANVTRITRQGEKNRQTSESGPKRKNEHF